jgi:murein DD-endopeptidase MepM/ murein hydrolase activator NlpD
VKAYSGGIRHDYKDSRPGHETADRRSLSWFALGLALPIVSVVLFLVSGPNESRVPDEYSVAVASATPLSGSPSVAEPTPLAAATTVTAKTLLPAPKPIAVVSTRGEPTILPLPPALDLEARQPARPPAEIERSSANEHGTELDIVIARGDTLDRVFRRNELSVADLAAMVALPDAKQHLTLLKPGDEVRIVHDDGRVLSLSRELNESAELWITRQDTGFAATEVEREIEKRTVGAHGTIKTSLFEAAHDAGIADGVIMDMAGIFQWDIDFIQDVRDGDSFTVVYEELWRDGIKLKDGSIVAAEFVNRGESYRAARYVHGDDDGGYTPYFTPDGRSVRKAFIRAPVEFTRISSNFNPNRRHPVLNTIRAHRGVDYAAPTGTPVMAAGDGKVQFRGVNGGYGNAIVLQHGGNITTLYGHLSKFGRFRTGSRVKQGDIIGYVGMSGLATGPHLHYEYRIDGVHRNPRTVALPPADPVPPEYQADFKATTATLWHQLDLYQRTQFAGVID